MKIFTLLAGLFLLSSSCAWSGGEEPSTPLARVHRLDVGPGSVAIGVLGSGCTRSEDFALRVQSLSPLTLAIDRVVPDLCRARKRAYSISLDYLQLPEDVQRRLQAGHAFKLENSLYPLPNGLRK